MMLKVGKLYACEKYHLLLYPDQETAAADDADPATTATAAGAAYWSNRLGKPVFYTDKNIPLLVLNSKEKFYEVLAGDRKGWIIYKAWLNIKEIV